MFCIMVGLFIVYLLTVLFVFSKLMKKMESKGHHTKTFDNKDWRGVWLCAFILPLGFYIIFKNDETGEGNK